MQALSQNGMAFEGSVIWVSLIGGSTEGDGGAGRMSIPGCNGSPPGLVGGESTQEAAGIGAHAGLGGDDVGDGSTGNPIVSMEIQEEQGGGDVLLPPRRAPASTRTLKIL